MTYDQAVKKVNPAYRDISNSCSGFPEIIGISESMSQVRKTVERIGPTDLNVIIYGDNGTGKDLVAEALHWNSGRSREPFVKINPLMIPCDDGEGNKTAEKENVNRCEASKNLCQVFNSASGGTLFIDRIQEIPLEGQVTLLRFFRGIEGTYGDGNGEPGRAPRFLASSTRDLTGLIQEGIFRADLFHRLNEISIYLPPLRERKEDIMPLSDYFLRMYARKYRKRIPSVCSQTFELFHRYEWPGNVRELSNVIHRLVVLGNEEQICEELKRSMERPNRLDSWKEESGVEYRVMESQIPIVEWPGKQRKLEGEPVVCEGLKDISQRVVEKVEMEAIMRVLEYTQWHRKKAARLLGVNYRTLLNKIRKYGLGDNLETQERSR